MSRRRESCPEEDGTGICRDIKKTRRESSLDIRPIVEEPPHFPDEDSVTSNDEVIVTSKTGNGNDIDETLGEQPEIYELPGGEDTQMTDKQFWITTTGVVQYSRSLDDEEEIRDPHTQPTDNTRGEDSGNLVVEVSDVTPISESPPEMPAGAEKPVNLFGSEELISTPFGATLTGKIACTSFGSGIASPTQGENQIMSTIVENVSSPTIFAGEENENVLLICTGVNLRKFMKEESRYASLAQGVFRILAEKANSDNVRIVFRQSGTWTVALNSPMKLVGNVQATGDWIRFTALDSGKPFL